MTQHCRCPREGTQAELSASLGTSWVTAKVAEGCAALAKHTGQPRARLPGSARASTAAPQLCATLRQIKAVQSPAQSLGSRAQAELHTAG